MDVDILDLRHCGVEGAIASFLVRGPEGPILVESGPSSTLPSLRSALEKRGVALDEISDVLVTHIHLDHAGAVGILAEGGARIHVHKVGAPHLVDPERLLKSALRIFGERMDELWGEFRAVPEGSLVTYRGGETLRVQGLEIRVHDTPGHARHHLVFEMDGLLFTGDAACVRIPGTNFVDPPAVPPEFDLEAWLRTLDLLRGLGATRLYPTHFGSFTDVTSHLDRAEASLREVTAFVGERLEQGQEEAALLDSYRAWQRERALAQGLDESHLRICAVANPPEISVGGLVRYWARKRGG